jgi:membrane-bound metal-dependent hydrolase YbcI (DUF457 family)
MTVFEHTMVGISGTVAFGLERRGGWRLVALAGLCAALPDWDGLTLLLGGSCYAEGHRVWGHNLLVGALAAALVAALLYRVDLLGGARRWLCRRWPALPPEDPAGPSPRSAGGWATWTAVAILASYSHLALDVAYSTGRNLSDWGVPLGWPFSARQWTFPSVKWGDATATLVLAAGMFAMLRWPPRAQSIAAASLVLVLGYIFFLRAVWR